MERTERMIVGGRVLELSKADVLRKMQGIQPEPIREHLVEMFDTVYPPKQVLAVVAGWDRQSFTTMEAQRVLNKLDFVCRRAGHRTDGQAAWGGERSEDRGPTDTGLEDRLRELEAGLIAAHQAVAGLNWRVTRLEKAPS